MNQPILGRILVVDDEIELREALVEALQKKSYEARGFTNGHEALEALRMENFDVLLTDLMMPEMDGITLISAALEIAPHLVPIIMSGQSTNQTTVEAAKVGAFDCLLKPFRVKTLMPVLARAMNMRRLEQESSSFKHATTHIRSGSQQY